MSAQFGNQQQQPHSAQWNVPPGAPGHNLPPNPQIWNVPTAQPWNPPASYQWNNPANTVMTQSPAFHQEFLKGKPKSLGVILIVVGILHIGMGIGQLYTSFQNAGIIGIPFWGAIFNIIAGSLSVAAVSKPSMCLIKGSLGLSIVLSIFSVTGVLLNIADFLYPFYNTLSYCYYDCSGLLTGGHVLRGLFILTYLLQFSVSVSLSVFACRADSYANLTQPAQVFVIQNGGEVLQTNAAPGTYPMYPPQQPPQLPYMTQGGMNGGPTA
ncbi:membrane-spanning 4-domains subfamily A member 4A-like [Mantella aurantiaca]